MAVVYLAEQPSLKRYVALKVLKPSLASDETYVKRFQREAQAAAALVHANIVQIYEVGQADGTYYIAQEYVQGLNLRQWTTRNGAPDLRLALAVMRQVTAALAKAAEHGIVHRDIKPENVLLTRAGEIKVTDFGLARFPRAAESVDLTQVGITVGSPLYMSPEQVEGRALDSRSDLYSFGVTCYQMLAGSPPFSGETPLSVALQHLNKQPEPLETHRPDLPAALCRSVHKMLAKNPEHRFQTPQELLRELRRIYQANLGDQSDEGLADWDIPGVELPGLQPNEATQRLDELMKARADRSSARRRWLFWAAAVATAFLLGGTLGGFVTQRESLLADAASARSPIPRLKTPLQQWWLALRLGTPEAWESVINYFPEQKDEYWPNHAKRNLAKIYFTRGEREKARELFDELAALNRELNPQLWAFGVIGQAAILTMEHNYKESAALIGHDDEELDKIRDTDMKTLLDRTREINKSELGELSPAEFDEWLNGQLQKPN
jgi:serine/threonine-protein kinase